MGRIGAIGLALALSACGLTEAKRISAMNQDEIRGVSDYNLCNAYIDGRVAEEERRRRQLRCTNSADNPASWYLLQQYGSPPQQRAPAQPQTITCRPVPGNATQCTSW